MSMRKSSRSELRMLRMMMNHFGTATKCYFCKEPLLKLEDLIADDGTWHIIRGSIPIKTKLTIHHKDGNHKNNEESNRKPCHRTCHRSFHMKETQHAKHKKSIGTKL